MTSLAEIYPGLWLESRRFARPGRNYHAAYWPILRYMIEVEGRLYWAMAFVPRHDRYARVVVHGKGGRAVGYSFPEVGSDEVRGPAVAKFARRHLERLRWQIGREVSHDVVDRIVWSRLTCPPLAHPHEHRTEWREFIEVAVPGALVEWDNTRARPPADLGGRMLAFLNRMDSPKVGRVLRELPWSLRLFLHANRDQLHTFRLVEYRHARWAAVRARLHAVPPDHLIGYGLGYGDEI